MSDWGVQDEGGPGLGSEACDPDPNYRPWGGAERRQDEGLPVLLGLRVHRAGRLEPDHPGLQGTDTYPANADGDAHSSNYDDARKLLFTADEDFCPHSGPGIGEGWGYSRVYDYSNAAAPQQIRSFRTRNSLAIGDKAAGDYTLHNAFVVGTDVYMSWYSDGVRIVDASDPADLNEVGFFVPPTDQPRQAVAARRARQTPRVWGVVVEDG